MVSTKVKRSEASTANQMLLTPKISGRSSTAEVSNTNILEKESSEPNEAHATSVALIFMLSLVTALFYGFAGNLDYKAAWRFVPWGVLGAISGAIFLKKIKSEWLKRIFGGIVTVAAVRMLFS